MEKYKAAIFGCKNMGAKHLKVLREFAAADVEVVGIMNSTPQSSAVAAEIFKTGYFKQLEDVNPAQVNLAIIATPASYHAHYAAYLLGRGIPCLVEKPFALNENECMELILLSEKNKTPLMIGYQEVFNPAVVALKKELKNRVVTSYHAVRETLSFGSNTDTTIVPNLMSHDLSVLHYLTGIKADEMKGLQIGVDIQRNLQSYAHVSFQGSNNVDVDLLAQVSKDKVVRRAENCDDIGNVYQLDYVACELRKNGGLIISGGNPLANEHRHFIHCCRSGEIPLNNGRCALEVERLSAAIDDSLKKNYSLALAKNAHTSAQLKKY